ncbi:MAG: methyltransferase domain-containing protein [Chthoniobacterales bacterium]|nr:methyltransferase domain-containing protein [Chthoniobacterales bacterium]
MDWNIRYAEGDTPWDKGLAHPVLREPLVRGMLEGRVLVPGCGTGHDVRELALGGLEVTGLDVAPLAIGRALAHPPVARETYVHGDLFGLPAEFKGAFDGVFEHTCFCAIDPARRADYASAVASTLKPGGRLLAVFYTEPDNGGDGPPFGCTAQELDELFKDGFRLLGERRGVPTFAGREDRELLRLFKRV